MKTGLQINQKLKMTLRKDNSLIIYLSGFFICAIGAFFLLNRPVVFAFFLAAIFLFYFFLSANTNLIFILLLSGIFFVPWENPGEYGWGAPSARLFGVSLTPPVLLIFFFGFLMVLINLRNKSKKIFDIPLFKAFFGFFLVGLVSSVSGLNPGNSTYILIFRYLTPAFGLLFISYLACKNRKSFFFLTVGIISVGTITALYGIFEYLIGSNPINTFCAWHFQTHLHPAIYTEKIGTLYQSTSTFGNPEFAATFFISSVLLSIGYLQFLKTFKKKFFLFLVLFINLLGIMFTFSRGEIFGLLLSIIIFIILLKGPSKILLVRAIAILLVIVVLFLLVFAKDISGKRLNIYSERQSTSFTHRAGSYKLMWSFLESNYFLGIGLGNYEKKYAMMSTSIFSATPTMDNMYLTILTETGIIGFAIFLTMMIWLFKILGGTLRKLKSFDIAPIFLSIFCALIGMAISFLFYEGFRHLVPAVIFWALSGIGLSVARNLESFQRKLPLVPARNVHSLSSVK